MIIVDPVFMFKVAFTPPEELSSAFYNCLELCGGFSTDASLQPFYTGLGPKVHPLAICSLSTVILTTADFSPPCPQYLSIISIPFITVFLL